MLLSGRRCVIGVVYQRHTTGSTLLTPRATLCNMVPLKNQSIPDKVTMRNECGSFERCKNVIVKVNSIGLARAPARRVTMKILSKLVLF